MKQKNKIIDGFEKTVRAMDRLPPVRPTQTHRSRKRPPAWLDRKRWNSNRDRLD